MFQFLRRMIVPIILIALIGFLATIVFQWGMDISSRRDYVSATTAAVINGEEITWTDFNVIYDRFYQGEVANSDEDLSEYRKKELRTAAWQQILHDRLLMQEAERYKITVTDEELFAFLRFAPPPDLQQLPYFQTDGVFDYQKYLAAMADPGAAPFWASVEPRVRREIKKQKLQEIVIQTVQLTNQETRDWFWADNEKIRIGMVNVPFSRFSSAPASTDEDLRTYFQQHQDDYQVEKRAVLNLVTLSKEPQAYDWEIDSARAVQIHDSIMAGADFYELAQYYSDDMTAESGGDLGWFRQDQMVGPFDDKVFSMAPGEVSEPVKTQFGWHIIKLHEFRDNTDTPDGKKVREAHASHILFRVTASAETLDRLHRRLEDFRSAAAEYGFEQSATNFELELLTSGAFTTGSIIDHLGYDPVASEFAFTQELGTISSVLENQNLVYVAQVAEILPAGVAAFEEVKDQVKLDYESFVIKRLCHDTAQAIYAEVEAGTELKGAAGAHGAEYTTPDEFTRNSYIRGLGIAPEAIGAAFALTERGQVSPPIDYARGTVIMQLLERTAPDTTVFADKRDSLSSAILSSKQQELYGSWFDNLVQNSDIINNIESSYQQTEY